MCICLYKCKHIIASAYVVSILSFTFTFHTHVHMKRGILAVLEYVCTECRCEFCLSSFQALLHAINNGGHGNIIEPAVCTLRHITSHHPNAEMAQNAVRQQNGIPLLAGFLLQQCHWPLLKALIGVLHNLTLCQENHAVLQEQSCIPKLLQWLNHENANKRSVMGGPPGYIVSGDSSLVLAYLVEWLGPGLNNIQCWQCCQIVDPSSLPL